MAEPVAPMEVSKPSLGHSIVVPVGGVDEDGRTISHCAKK
jgi:hypothetical protein